jgi:hypothetical protein
MITNITDVDIFESNVRVSTTLRAPSLLRSITFKESFSEIVRRKVRREISEGFSEGIFEIEALGYQNPCGCMVEGGHFFVSWKTSPLWWTEHPLWWKAPFCCLPNEVEMKQRSNS